MELLPTRGVLQIDCVVLSVARLWCVHSSRFTGDTVAASDPGHCWRSQPRPLLAKSGDKWLNFLSTLQCCEKLLAIFHPERSREVNFAGKTVRFSPRAPFPQWKGSPLGPARPNS